MISGAVDRWVVNASPVILLGKAGIVRFLPALCGELVVPQGVLLEVADGNAADAGRAWLNGPGRTHLRQVGTLHPALATWGGGAGEAEVITWALQNPGFTAVLDDRTGRRAALRSGIVCR